RGERRAQLVREQLGLFPGCEVAAPLRLAPVDEVRVDLLAPLLRWMGDLAREDGVADRELELRGLLPGGNRGLDGSSLLPVQPRRRRRRTGQPRQGDVVKHVVTR